MCELVGTYAFAECSSLTSVYLSKCKQVSYGAFNRCSNLTYVNLPVCTTLHSNAFDKCIALTHVSLPVCTYASYAAFQECSSLTNIILPKCTKLSSGVFRSCINLSTVELPECSYIDAYAFYNCYNLSSVNLPLVQNAGSSVYYGCSKLTSVDFPWVTYVYASCFVNCTSLSIAMFGSAYSYSGQAIYSNAFTNCNKLMKLILYVPRVANLYNVNAFASTPMSDSTYTGAFGSIYVPASLVDAYKKATNWATYADRITAIPEIITFSIGDITYQAEENMTWGDWVNSQYNTDNYTVDEDGWIIHPDRRYITNDEVLYVPELERNPIQADEVYMLTN